MIEALITGIGFGATAALIQKAFVANRYNLLWISTALANSVAIVGIIATFLNISKKDLEWLYIKPIIGNT